MTAPLTHPDIPEHARCSSHAHDLPDDGKSSSLAVVRSFSLILDRACQRSVEGYSSPVRASVSRAIAHRPSATNQHHAEGQSHGNFNRKHGKARENV